jgi:hypothetical protein
VQKADGQYALFYVELTSDLSAGDVSFYMYYGKADATSASSITGTFPKYITHEGGDISEWDSTFETATKTASTDYPHSGTYGLKLVPAVGSPNPSGCIETIGTYKSGYAWGFLVYDTGRVTADYAAMSRVQDTSANILYAGIGDAYKQLRYYDGAGYILTKVWRKTGTHRFVEYCFKSTTTIVKLDGYQVVESTRIVEANLDNIRVYCYRDNPQASYFDDLYVRKFVDPEPAFDPPGSEETQVTEYTKTFSGDAFLEKALTKIFQVDAVLRTLATKAFLANARIIKANTKTLLADAYLKKEFTKTFIADAQLETVFTKTFTTDAILTLGLIPYTKTFLADAFLKATLIKTLSIDALIERAYTKTFQSDAIIRLVTTKTFTVDSFVKATLIKTVTADAFVEKSFTKTFSSNSILRLVKTKTFTLDAYLKATLTKTFTIDALVGLFLATLKTFPLTLESEDGILNLESDDGKLILVG